MRIMPERRWAVYYIGWDIAKQRRVWASLDTLYRKSKHAVKQAALLEKSGIKSEWIQVRQVEVRALPKKR